VKFSGAVVEGAMAKRIHKKSGVARSSLQQLKHLAKAGADATLHRIHDEIAAIERTFPELSSTKGRANIMASANKSVRTMSATARRAVSARMKKYRHERRKGAAKAEK
jgi:hypothetical protein